ncbi:MAG TPA: hypothetical protein V6D13_16755 [Halomicronema sp.]
MSLLLTIATDESYSQTLKTAYYAVLGVGFLAAVVIGSIAWYNSKRPAGWENAEAPNWVPKVKSSESNPDEQTK